MEKQTMGAFIAALRKANGLTQKELAEKLNVSDKAVSRWERDESYPDLTLVPLIADIFGVTSDELLRGVKNTGGDISQCGGASEKRIKILIKRLSARYKNQRIISLGIAFFGLALALLVNFAALKSYLAFGLAVLFCVAAFILNAVFTNTALSAVNTDEIANDEVTAFCHKVKNKSWLTYAVIAVITVFCMPLLISGGEYYGLDFMSWFYPGAALAAALTVLLLIIVSVVVIKGTKGLSFSEKQRKNARLKLCIFPVFIVCVAVSVIGMLAVHDYGIFYFTNGTVLETREEFVEFMRTYHYDDEDFTVPATVSPTGYDEYIGGPSEENIPGYDTPDAYNMYSDTAHVPDDNGGILFDYPRNEDVVSMKFGNGKDRMPITVYTREDSIRANGITDRLTVLFILLYIVEAVLPFVIYFRKKEC